MFEQYVACQAVDDVRARRLAAAGSIAVAATLVMGVFAWTANKLSIRGVSPPTVSHMLVQMQDLEVPPPPPPPAAPKGEPPDHSTTSTIPDEPPPIEPPEDLVVPSNDPPRRIGDPPGDPLAPRCVPPACGTGIGIGDPTAIGRSVPRLHRREPAARPVKQPLDVLRSKALFAPDPDAAKLRRTRSGVFGRGGTNRTHFCVDVDGSVTDVRTARKFPGDPEVDRICRETVARWRFDPLRVGARARKTCGVVSFRIDFAR